MKTRRTGFLLVMVVVLLAIAGLMLSQVATVSLRSAAQSVRAERELRNKWAELSIRDASLTLAPTLLSMRPMPDGAQATKSPNTLWKDFELSGIQWRVVIANESAKLPVASLVDKRGIAKTESMMASVLEADSLTAQSNGLKSSVRGKTSLTSRRWERWLDIDSERSLTGESIARATRRLTLWGNGKIDIRNCDDEVLSALWNGLLGHAVPPEIHERRRQANQSSLDSLLAGIGVRDGQREVVRPWLTTEPNCVSIWVFRSQTYGTQTRVASGTFYVRWTESGVASDLGYLY